MNERNEVESMDWLERAWLNGLAKINDLVGYPDGNGQMLLEWGIRRWPQAAADGYKALVLGEVRCNVCRGHDKLMSDIGMTEVRMTCDHRKSISNVKDNQNEVRNERNELNAPSGYVSADWILDNLWNFPNETWWEAMLNGEHRQFARIRLDIEKQEYVLDVVGQDRKYSEELWRYKGGDWQFLSHNR